jgi:hypothetical protein
MLSERLCQRGKSCHFRWSGYTPVHENLSDLQQCSFPSLSSPLCVTRFVSQPNIGTFALIEITFAILFCSIATQMIAGAKQSAYSSDDKIQKNAFIVLRTDERETGSRIVSPWQVLLLSGSYETSL